MKNLNCNSKSGKSFNNSFLKVIFITVFGLLFSYNASSQLYTGGNVSVNYNEGYYLDIAPLIGYKIKFIDFGFSPFYSYADREKSEPEYAFGARIFTQITFYKDIFGHAEVQLMNTPIAKSDNRMWVVSMPIGLGYRYPITPSTTAYGMILYDVLLHPNSTAKNPIIRGGVTHNF
jgi:hypothetical protein